MAEVHTMAGGSEFGLAELIDLELCLRADRERTLTALLERDGEIAARVGVEALDDRALVARWVREVRGADSRGRDVERFWRSLGAGLFVVGLVLGFGAVAAWLATGNGTPVNVVVFWPAVIGLPLLFALGWVVAALPGDALDRVPGLGALIELLRSIASWVPTALGGLFARIGGAGARASLGELRRLDLLYGRLRFWLLTGLTQAFALGFAVGASGALIGIPYVDDPAFGWRSRLTSVDQLHQTVSIIATPWARFRPDAVPSRGVIDETRYSSVDPRFVGGAVPPGNPEVWAAWWPFLVASMLVYGLLVRIVTALVSRIALTRALRRAPVDDIECRRLLARLRRSLELDAGGPQEDGLATADALGETSASELGGEDLWVLRWAGEALDATSLEGEIRTSSGAARIAVAGEVGGLDPAGDDTALRSVPGGDDVIALVVDGWEPPVGDHADFLAKLRNAAGGNRAIWVLLRTGPAAEAEAALRVWRTRLGETGDPWLRVAGLSG